MRERELRAAAKRGVCGDVADWMIGGPPSHGLLGPDRERFEEVWNEVKDEMMRRAGRERPLTVVDERQIEMACHIEDCTLSFGHAGQCVVEDVA